MKSIRSIFVFAVASMLFVAGPVSFAHDTEKHSEQKGPNGGQIRIAGNYHFELVMAADSKVPKDNPLTVYVTDVAGKKVLSAGASGSATILAGKTKVTAPLLPDGDNRFKGTANYASLADVKVVVSITLSGKPAENARFIPFAVAKDAHAGHKH